MQSPQEPCMTIPFWGIVSTVLKWFRDTEDSNNTNYMVTFWVIVWVICVDLPIYPGCNLWALDYISASTSFSPKKPTGKRSTPVYDTPSYWLVHRRGSNLGKPVLHADFVKPLCLYLCVECHQFFVACPGTKNSKLCANLGKGSRSKHCITPIVI